MYAVYSDREVLVSTVDTNQSATYAEPTSVGRSQRHSNSDSLPSDNMVSSGTPRPQDPTPRPRLPSDRHWSNSVPFEAVQSRQWPTEYGHRLGNEHSFVRYVPPMYSRAFNSRSGIPRRHLPDQLTTCTRAYPSAAGQTVDLWPGADWLFKPALTK